MRAEPLAAVTVRPARRVRGRVRVPGDKSLSHRYAILGALADGRTTIARFAPGDDCRATLDCLARLGVEIATHPGASDRADEDATVDIGGRGVRGLQPSSAPLDARNSGTTLRLLAGVLAAHPFETTLTGDASLSRRPMRRLIDPLERMGACIAAEADRPPLVVRGGDLHGIEYALPVPSAQVKSAVLLAGLQAEGRTNVREPVATRDHTERGLRAFGAAVDRDGDRIGVAGGQRLRARALRVPGDLSSAAYWAVAAAALPDSEVELIDVGLNPTRTAILDVLRRIGAEVEVTPEADEAFEPRGRVRVRHRALRALTVEAGEVSALIDELPALAALAAHGVEVSVSGAAELRVKESDRIASLVRGLRALGVAAEERPDGFRAGGAARPAGGLADAAGDHRLAMAFAIAALAASRSSVIMGADAVGISYPGFFETLEEICE